MRRSFLSILHISIVYGAVFILILNSTSSAQSTKNLANSVIKSTVSIKMINPLIGSYIQGSAFSVGKGRFVTNYHVVEFGKEGFIQISAKDSTKIQIKRIVTFDVEHDLAIVEIDTTTIPALELAESSLEVGEKVYVCGNPLGLTGTFSDGIVSANRTIKKRNVIQITAPVSSGSSGGPVINENGKVIGVIFSTMLQGQNLNFVIPSKYLKQLLSAENYSYKLPWYNKTFTGTKMKSIYSTKFDSKKDISNLKLKVNKYNHSVYEMAKESNRAYIYGNVPYLLYKPDFKIVASIKTKKDGESCIYWGNMKQGDGQSVMSGLQNYYYGICSMNNSVWVELINNGNASIKQEPIALENPNEGFKKYAIEKHNDSLYFKIDSQVVFKEEYLRNPGNNVGLGGHGPFEIEIDHVEVFQDQDSIQVIKESEKLTKSELYLMEKQNDMIFDETPIIGLNNKESFFTRYVYNKKGMESSVYSLKSFSDKVEKSAFLSDGLRNYIFAVSPNSNVFYIEKANSDQELQTNHGLFVYNKSTGIKTDFPAIEEFYKISSYSLYYLSSDANYLVSSLYRFDSFGGYDLFVSKKTPEGTYSAPLNLGSTINTDLDEGGVFMTPDTKYMFFTSKGHPGYGKKDLFVSKRLDSTWVRWSEPLNLGSAINSAEDEDNISLNAVTGELYFRNRSKEKYSFYKFKLPNTYVDGYCIYELKSKSLAKMSFVTVEIWDQSSSKLLASFTANPNSFYWAFNNGKDYKITLKSGAKVLIESSINLINQSGFQNKTLDLD